MTGQMGPRQRNGVTSSLTTRRTLLVTAAGAWSCLALIVGALWLAGIVASPFGSNDPRAGEVGSYFEGLDQRQTGLVAVAVGLIGVLTAIKLRRAPEGRWPVVPAIVLGLLLIVLVPDIRVIQNFAYLFFGYTGLWDGALAAELVAMAGGLLWLGAAAVRLEASGSGPFAPREPRWAKAVTYAAAALALPYPTVRIAWALGIPLGTTSDYIDAWGWPERLGVGLVFGGLPTIGMVLTIGLIRRWGETFPRWMPRLRGRRVPIWLAVVPGLMAAVMITQMGLRTTTSMVRELAAANLSWDSWGASLPGLFILPWGLALAAAVYAYGVRRTRPSHSTTSATIRAT